MHTEDDLLPISALQHLLFCERQTALIHVERLWEENRFTAEGRVLHRKADTAKSETRDGIRITRGLPVHSFELGLYGVCDVVQFKPPVMIAQPGRSLPKRIQEQLRFSRGQKTRPPLSTDGGPEHEAGFHLWTITPVEYKRGKPKENDCDRVQLCAQAMCLEEMLNVEIACGDLFYGQQQHRTEVLFDEGLRAITGDTTHQLHALIQSRQTPPAFREKKCDTCSLLSVCMPLKKAARQASAYLKNAVRE